MSAINWCDVRLHSTNDATESSNFCEMRAQLASGKCRDRGVAVRHGIANALAIIFHNVSQSAGISELGPLGLRLDIGNVAFDLN